MNDSVRIDEILGLAKKILRFMETRDRRFLEDIFCEQNLVIVDSFSPYVFQDNDAVEKWSAHFISHAKNLVDIKSTLGLPQEFSTEGNIAFLSLPVTWEGKNNKTPFYETGGLALVVVYTAKKWKIQNYAWAATSYIET